ncbi:MAG: hypothetical protein JNM82_10135, partial [Rhodocyclaceae bacterium]|nr:hypothetical protein [Rhodocyclaceae bacterium]
MAPPAIRRILIANRGEVAVRIARAAHDLGIATVAVFSDDDAENPHRDAADASFALGASGPAAYLDGGHLLRIAREAGCDAVHPGYGFLSERADFAGACATAGLVFIGPTTEQLEIFGDKARSRELARQCGVPLLPGTAAVSEPGSAQSFMAGLPAGAAVMVKAVAGGGGRGLRVVRDPADLAAALERCRSEALAAFGVGEVFVERWLPRARHVEIQVLGDGRDVVDFGERECSLQRRHQKLVELAPSPTLDPALRDALVQAALAMARKVGYRSLGTFEFLVDAEPGAEPAFAFLEVNPRLQVEHTVTEQVTGMDLVAAQIAVADGRGLEGLGLLDPGMRRVRGHAIQFRINAEVPLEDGSVRPSAGRIDGLHAASGPGIRVDSALRTGFSPPPAFDSLLAKLVVHSPSPDYADCVRRAQRALADFRIDGIATNLPFLAALARRDEFAANAVDTRFLEEHAMALAAAAGALAPIAPPGTDGQALTAPMAGRLVQVDVAPGDRIARGAQVAVVEAMKMEHPVLAAAAGRILAVPVAPGDAVAEGQVLAFLEAEAEEPAGEEAEAAADPDRIRPDLQRLLDRKAFLDDARRLEAVARRRAKGMRTARENVADLCDPGSFVEYGGLAIAAQRRRRPEEELIRETPADGLVAGIGTVNAGEFGPGRSRCLVMSYDYTVLAGTQGFMNHKKTDRMLRLAEEWELPVVLLAEGGGGRPGDTDMAVVTGLDVPTFASYARLSGRVPRVCVVAGHCFAGNAALAGCSDVIIATANASIGMGGPAMIEGG